MFWAFPAHNPLLTKEIRGRGGNGISRYNDYLSFNVEKETERCKNILPNSTANSEARHSRSIKYVLDKSLAKGGSTASLLKKRGERAIASEFEDRTKG